MSKQIPQSGKGQREQFSEILQQMRKDVTTADRREAAQELGITLATISYYLTGVLDNPETSAKLIRVLKDRIEQRHKMIA